MNDWKVLSILIASLVKISIACRQEDEFYFSDDSFGCQVYFMCKDGKVTEMRCPLGQSFEYFSNQCKDNSIVKCRKSHREADVLSRKKRQTTGVVVDFMEPAFSNLLNVLRDVYTMEDDSVTAKIILPSIYEMVGDPETKFYLKRIMWDLKAAYAPIIVEMIKQQSWNSPKGTIVKIPEAYYRTAWSKVENDTLPLLKKIVLKHAPAILRRASQNSKILYAAIKRLKNASKPHSGVLLDSIIRFVMKHGNAFLSSGDTERKSYAISEIKEDLHTIEFTIFQIFWGYLSQVPSMLMTWFFNPEASFLQVLMGGVSEVYAVPSYSTN